MIKFLKKIRFFSFKSWGYYTSRFLNVQLLQVVQNRCNMHALNTNEEMKMKKINYFGKEYTVSDDVEWVATCSSGNVLAFTVEPVMYCDTWVTYESGKRIGIWGDAKYDWKNSLRKVEDILVKEGHPHADLILKYAQIAQYDDKPWEYFEYETSTGWVTCLSMVAFNENVNYRLKPQEPKIQVGQKWVSKEDVEVTINVQSNKEIIVFTYKVGGVTHITSLNVLDFLKNFKRKE